MYYRISESKMSDTARTDAAYRLIAAAYRVMIERDGLDMDSRDPIACDNGNGGNVGTGYADGSSAYSNMSDLWVRGDWNDVTVYRDGERVILSTVPGRLFDALGRIGVNREWHDEYEPCGECHKLVRVQPDSYSWTPQYIISDSSGEVTCRTCLLDDPETYFGKYIGDEHSAVTWLTVDQLAEYGWSDAFPDDRDAVSGWHPGDSDTPTAVVDRWRDSDDYDDDYVWLFVITDQGQFATSHRMMVRPRDWADA